ncbi:MAG: hypothetical protein LQ351_003009 [Letrouitia transgressa]|nr:MAG: hypothetical protein LQ351_003009 [Letrouitia transgressa]
MSVEKDSSSKATEPPKASKDAYALLATNHSIWRLREAVEFYRPGIDKPKMVHRITNAPIDHHSVLLANAQGLLPARSKQANLKLHHWTPTEVFWTLESSGWNYMVEYYPRHSKFGAHWRRWLGLRDGLDDKPFAFPLKVSDSEPVTDASQNRPLAGSNSPSGYQSAVPAFQETVTEEAPQGSETTQNETHSLNERPLTQSRKRGRAVDPHSIGTGPSESGGLFTSPEQQPGRNAAPQKRRATLARVSGVFATPSLRNPSGSSLRSSLPIAAAALGASPAQRIGGITQNSQTTVEHDTLHENRGDKTATAISADVSDYRSEEEKIKVSLPKQFTAFTKTHKKSSGNLSTKSEN